MSLLVSVRAARHGSSIGEWQVSTPGHCFTLVFRQTRKQAAISEGGPDLAMKSHPAQSKITRIDGSPSVGIVRKYRKIESFSFFTSSSIA